MKTLVATSHEKLHRESGKKKAENGKSLIIVSVIFVFRKNLEKVQKVLKEKSSFLVQAILSRPLRFSLYTRKAGYRGTV